MVVYRMLQCFFFLFTFSVGLRIDALDAELPTEYSECLWSSHTHKHSDIFTIMHISGNNGEECPAGQHFDLKSANAIHKLPSNIFLRTLFYQS